MQSKLSRQGEPSTAAIGQLDGDSGRLVVAENGRSIRELSKAVGRGYRDWAVRWRSWSAGCRLCSVLLAKVGSFVAKVGKGLVFRT